MTRFLATGDWHIGAGTEYGRAPFGEGSRLEDQQRVVEQIAQLALDENVDAILHAGDFFHRRHPTPAEIVVFQAFLEALGDHIPVYGIDGNHCVSAADRPSTGWLFRDRMRVSRRPELMQVQDTIVCTLPWTPPARLVATMNGSVPRDEVNTVCAELLIDSARELRAQIPEEATKILLAHWSVSGSSLPNGLPVDQLREPVLPLSELEALGFGVIVLGHIHKGQVLATGNPIFYTGSPAAVDFGEANVPHGVWIIDTEHPDGKAVRFHEIADRPFVTVDVDLTMGPGDSTLDETDVIAARIAERFPLTDAVVRVRYKCTSEQARRVDAAALRGLLHDAGVSKVYSIAADVVREDRARVEGVDENLSELEALDAWIDANCNSLVTDVIKGGQGDQLRDLTARYLEETAA